MSEKDVIESARAVDAKFIELGLHFGANFNESEIEFIKNLALSHVKKYNTFYEISSKMSWDLFYKYASYPIPNVPTGYYWTVFVGHLNQFYGYYWPKKFIRLQLNNLEFYFIANGAAL